MSARFTSCYLSLTPAADRLTLVTDTVDTYDKGPTMQSYAKHVHEFKESAGLKEVSIGYVLAGDFAATPKSAQYSLLRKGALDEKDIKRLHKCPTVRSALLNLLVAGLALQPSILSVHFWPTLPRSNCACNARGGMAQGFMTMHGGGILLAPAVWAPMTGDVLTIAGAVRQRVAVRHKATGGHLRGRAEPQVRAAECIRINCGAGGACCSLPIG